MSKFHCCCFMACFQRQKSLDPMILLTHPFDARNLQRCPQNVKPIIFYRNQIYHVSDIILIVLIMISITFKCLLFIRKHQARPFVIKWSLAQGGVTYQLLSMYHGYTEVSTTWQLRILGFSGSNSMCQILSHDTEHKELSPVLRLLSLSLGLKQNDRHLHSDLLKKLGTTGQVRVMSF